MFTRSTVTALAGIFGAAVLAAGCREPAAFAPRDPETTTYTSAGTIAWDVATAITLDQQNSTLGESGRRLVKGFNPVNPRNGDAIVVSFFWVGSTNIITAVTDHLTNTSWTPVGNTYTRVEYVTAGGISMATYVATNVQNVPIANANQDNVLAVEALLSDSVSDGGIWMSAYSGVASASALGAHRSASGAGAAPTTTTLGSGGVANGTGSLVYGVTLSGPPVGMDPPLGFSSVDPYGSIGDFVLKADARYSVRPTAGSADPQWTWYYDPTRPGTWLSTGLVLNPSPHLVFAVQPSTALPLVAIQPAVQVAVVDADGNRVTNFTGQITIAIGHNGGLLLPGTLSGTKTVTVVNGVATFSDLSIDQAGNGYTLVATVVGATNTESAAFNIGVM